MRLRSILIVFVTALLIGAGGYFSYQYYQVHRTDDEIWMVPKDALLIAKCSSGDEAIDSTTLFAEVKPELGAVLNAIGKKEAEYYYSIHPEGNWVVYVSDHKLDLEDFGLDVSSGKLKAPYGSVSYADLHGHHIFTSNDSYLSQIEEQIDTRSLTFPNYSEESVLLTFDKTDLLSGVTVDSALLNGLEQVLPKNGEFSTELNQGDVRFNGSSDELEKYALLTSGQEQLDFRLYYLISNASEEILFFSLTDGVRFRDQFKKYDFLLDNVYDEEKALIKKEFSVDLEEFYYLINGQVGLTSLMIDGKKESVCMIPASDESKMRAKLLEVISQVSEDSLVFDTHNGYSIYDLEISEFPELLFGQAAHGFPTSKVTFYDQYMVLASSAKALRKVLIDIEDDNIWGRTIEENIKIEKYLTSCTAGYYVPNLRSEETLFLKGFDLLALQISSEGDEGFFNGALARVGGERNAIPVEAVVEEVEIADESSKIVCDLGVEIITKPYLVLNHASKKYDIMLQTVDDTLRNIGVDGGVNWKVKLSGPIIGDVEQVDLFKNGKIQYLVTTASKVYCFDRLGRMVENFPIIPPTGGSINDCSIVDYDHTKNYRFLVTTEKGEMFMYNKEGQSLQGWKPNKRLGLSSYPTSAHVRVKGKDYLFGVNDAGKLCVFRRNAELVPHFPYDLGRTNQGVFLERGADFASTYFSTITEDYRVSKVNLYGDEIMNRKLLGIKNAEIVPFIGKNNFVIAAQKGRDLVVFDREGEVSGVVPNAGNEFSLQAYVLESGKFYFLNSANGSGKFYNKEFIELKDIGLASQKVSLISQGNGQYRVYKVNQTTVELEDFRIQ